MLKYVDPDFLLVCLIFMWKSKGLVLFYCLWCQMSHSQLWWKTSVGPARRNQWKEDLLHPQEALGERNLYASLQSRGVMLANWASHHGSCPSCEARGGLKSFRYTTGRQEKICLFVTCQVAIIVLLSQREWPFPVILLLNDLFLMQYLLCACVQGLGIFPCPQRALAKLCMPQKFLADCRKGCRYGWACPSWLQAFLHYRIRWPCPSCGCFKPSDL